MKFDINAANFKPVAEKVVARLNSIGVVSRSGKPLVADHGYEAVAAVFGHRNQHAFRAVLEQPEHQAEKDWQALCGKQGWTGESQIIHLEGFLRDAGLLAQFVAYARAVADEENAEVAEFTAVGSGTYSRSAEELRFRLRLLEALGYVVALPDHPMAGWSWHYRHVAGGNDYLTQADAVMSAEIDAVDRVYDIKRSDLNGWYWELADEASDDFVTKEEARGAALKDLHALSRQFSALISKGYEIYPDANQPGMWIWQTDIDGCTFNLESIALTIRDAWKNSELHQSDSE